jgi:DNA-binding response OmpR family regulator
MTQILLVDDDPVQLHIRKLVLIGAGFSVSVATNAEAALALLRSEPLASDISAIVTDHILPGANGAEFVRQVRDVDPSVPIVVISGLSAAEDEYAGLNIAFLQKPCPPPELIALVRSVALASPGRMVNIPS